MAAPPGPAGLPAAPPALRRRTAISYEEAQRRSQFRLGANRLNGGSPPIALGAHEQVG